MSAAENDAIRLGLVAQFFGSRKPPPAGSRLLYDGIGRLSPNDLNLLFGALRYTSRIEFDDSTHASGRVHGGRGWYRFQITDGRMVVGEDTDQAGLPYWAEELQRRAEIGEANRQEQIEANTQFLQDRGWI